MGISTLLSKFSRHPPVVRDVAETIAVERNLPVHPTPEEWEQYRQEVLSVSQGRGAELPDALPMGVSSKVISDSQLHRFASPEDAAQGIQHQIHQAEGIGEPSPITSQIPRYMQEYHTTPEMDVMVTPDRELRETAYYAENGSRQRHQFTPGSIIIDRSKATEETTAWTRSMPAKVGPQQDDYLMVLEWQENPERLWGMKVRAPRDEMRKKVPQVMKNLAEMEEVDPAVQTKIRKWLHTPREQRKIVDALDIMQHDVSTGSYRGAVDSVYTPKRAKAAKELANELHDRTFAPSEAAEAEMHRPYYRELEAEFINNPQEVGGEDFTNHYLDLFNTEEEYDAVVNRFRRNAIPDSYKVFKRSDETNGITLRDRYEAMGNTPPSLQRGDRVYDHLVAQMLSRALSQKQRGVLWPKSEFKQTFAMMKKPQADKIYGDVAPKTKPLKPSKIEQAWGRLYKYYGVEPPKVGTYPMKVNDPYDSTPLLTNGIAFTERLLKAVEKKGIPLLGTGGVAALPVDETQAAETQSPEQVMLSKMQESGQTPKDKWNKPRYYESDEARQAAIIKEMQGKEWSNVGVSGFMYPTGDGEVRPTGPLDIVMTETPGLAPLYKGVSTANAGIAAMVENVYPFTHGLHSDMSTQWRHPGEFPALSQVGQEFSSDIGKWEDRLQTDRWGYEPTPGNQMIRGVGEFVGPIAGTTAKVTHGALRTPITKLSPSIDEVTHRLTPDFSIGRREAMGTIGKGAVATGVALTTGKLLHHADDLTRVGKAKAGRVAAKATGGRWDSLVDEIYAPDIVVSKAQSKGVAAQLPRKSYRRPAHLAWAHEPYLDGSPMGRPGDELIQRFNRYYDLEQIPGGKAFVHRAKQLGKERQALIDKHGLGWHTTKEGKQLLRERARHYNNAPAELKESMDIMGIANKQTIARMTPKNRDLLRRRYELEGQQETLVDKAYDEIYELNALNNNDLGEAGVDEAVTRLLGKDIKAQRIANELDALPSSYEIVKYDPNTIRYRAVRMKAMLKEHGEELFHAETRRLREVVKGNPGNPEAVQGLENHLEIGKRLSIGTKPVTATDILNKIK